VRGALILLGMLALLAPPGPNSVLAERATPNASTPQAGCVDLDPYLQRLEAARDAFETRLAETFPDLDASDAPPEAAMERILLEATSDDFESLVPLFADYQADLESMEPPAIAEPYHEAQTESVGLAARVFAEAAEVGLDAAFAAAVDDFVTLDETILRAGEEGQAACPEFAEVRAFFGEAEADATPESAQCALPLVTQDAVSTALAALEAYDRQPTTAGDQARDLLDTWTAVLHQATQALETDGESEPLRLTIDLAAAMVSYLTERSENRPASASPISAARDALLRELVRWPGCFS
jgi:hypothetical protein